MKQPANAYKVYASLGIGPRHPECQSSLNHKTVPPLIHKYYYKLTSGSLSPCDSLVIDSGVKLLHSL